MNDKKRLNSYEDLPLVLDVADIQQISLKTMYRASCGAYLCR